MKYICDPFLSLFSFQDPYNVTVGTFDAINFCKIFIFSIIVDLQCSVNFCCTAKGPGYTYTHVDILFLTLPSIMFHHKRLGIVPCAIQQNLIAYLLQMQEFVSTKPKLLAIYSPPPLATTSLFSMSMSFFSVERFICAMY